MFLNEGEKGYKLSLLLKMSIFTSIHYISGILFITSDHWKHMISIPFWDWHFTQHNGFQLQPSCEILIITLVHPLNHYRNAWNGCHKMVKILKYPLTEVLLLRGTLISWCNEMTLLSSRTPAFHCQTIFTLEEPLRLPCPLISAVFPNSQFSVSYSHWLIVCWWEWSICLWGALCRSVMLKGGSWAEHKKGRGSEEGDAFYSIPTG